MTHLSLSSKKATSQPNDPWQELPFDPWLVVATLRRNWFWATPIGLVLAACAAFFVYWTFTPEYLASHLLEANRDFVVFQGMMQSPTDFVQNERPLIENHLVLSPVLANAKVNEAPSLRDINRRELNIRRNLSISDAGSRNLLKISYRDSDPASAANVCNAIAKSYLQQRQRFDDRRISDLEGWLQPALKLWQDEVEQHRERIVNLSKQTKGFDPFQETSRMKSDTSHLTALRDDLSILRSSEAVLEAELMMLKEAKVDSDQRLPVEIDPREIEAVVDQHPEVERLMKERDEKLSEIREMERSDLVRFRQDWHDGLKNDTRELEEKIEKARVSVRPEVLAKWRESTVIAKSSELTRARTRREVVEANYEAEEDRLSQFAGETAELYFAQQKYLQARNILERLNERVASLRTERQKSSTIQTLAEATPPSSPIESIPWKKIMLFAMAAFCVPYAIAFLFELKNKRVSSAEVLEIGKEIPVLGELAKLPSRFSPSRKQRVYDESVESLRTNFMFARPDGIQTLLIASSMPREGKSTLASHLSISLSRVANRPVLLIDADMRSPDQHNLFGVPMSGGLAGVLEGTVTLDEAIDKSLGGQLHLLTAGRLQQNLYQMVSQERIAELMRAVKERYQFIVFDTAPVLAASETLSFAAAADGTLLCTMRDVSRQAHLQRCVRRLEASGATIVGTVFSGVPTREYYYRYGDYEYTIVNNSDDQIT